MMKRIVAVAVASTLAAGPALAQVTIYGVIDNAYVATKKAAGESVSGVQSSVWSTDRIGFRGSEDLGGGLKANFGVESNIGSDRAESLTFGDRGIFVGVSGAFGDIKVGGALPSTMNNIRNSGAHGANIGRIDGTDTAARHNGFVYTTPSFNGFNVEVGMGFGETTTAGIKDNGNTQSVALNGKVGAFSFMLVQGQQTVQASANAGSACKAFVANSTNATIQTAAVVGVCAPSVFATAPASVDAITVGQLSAGANGIVGAQNIDTVIAVTEGSPAVAAQDYKVKSTGLNASYDLGIAKVTYQYLATKNSGTRGSVAAVDNKAQGISVAGKMGAVTPFVAYREFSDKLASTQDSDAYTIGASYALSKRTLAYVAHERVDNKSAGVSTVSIGSYAAPTAGTDPSITAIGLRHSF